MYNYIRKFIHVLFAKYVNICFVKFQVVLLIMLRLNKHSTSPGVVKLHTCILLSCITCILVYVYVLMGLMAYFINKLLLYYKVCYGNFSPCIKYGIETSFSITDQNRENVMAQ